MAYNDHMTDADWRRLKRRQKSKKPTTEVLLPNQPGRYDEFCPQYWENGLKAFPARDKKPLVAGATGLEGIITFEKVTEWAQHPAFPLCSPLSGG